MKPIESIPLTPYAAEKIHFRHLDFLGRPVNRQKHQQRIKPIPIYEKQRQFRQSPAWLRGFFGGRGTGKTVIASLDILARAVDGDPWMGISPDANVIRDTTLPTFLDFSRQTGQLINHVVSPVPRVWFRTRDGGTADILFKSAEVPDKLRGPSKAGLWLDEATVMIQEVIDIAMPVLRHKGRMGPLILTATPKGTKHWTFNLFYEPIDELQAMQEPPENVAVFAGKFFRRRPNTDLVRASTKDNPFLPPEFYDNIKSRYGAVLAEQELEGEFLEIQGTMFRREWFRFSDSAPRLATRIRFWDRAATPGGGSFTAGVLVARSHEGVFYIEHVIRGQWSAHERDRIIRETAERDRRRYNGEVLIYVEQEGGSGGKEVAQQMIQQLAEFPVFRDLASGTRYRKVNGEKLPGDAKIVRAMPFAAQAEAGNVFIVRGDWNESFLDEVVSYPEYIHADQVDAASAAINKLATSAVGDPGEILRRSNELQTGEKFGAIAEVQEMQSSRWENLPWRLK